MYIVPYLINSFPLFSFFIFIFFFLFVFCLCVVIFIGLFFVYMYFVSVMALNEETVRFKCGGGEATLPAFEKKI